MMEPEELIKKSEKLEAIREEMRAAADGQETLIIPKGPHPVYRLWGHVGDWKRRGFGSFRAEQLEGGHIVLVAYKPKMGVVDNDDAAETHEEDGQ